jgi:hypothetical protein
MKKMTFSLTGMLLLLLGFFSCSKENNDVLKSVRSKSSSNSTVQFGKFSDLQIDQIGILHNDLLKEYIVTCYNTNRETNISKFLEYDHPLVTESINEAPISERIIVHNFLKSQTSLNNEKLDQLFTQFSAMIDNSNSIGQIIDQTNNLMNTVKLDNSYTTTEYNAAMAMLSVGKNSAIFWNPDNSTENYGYRIIVANNSGPIGIINWKEILKRDAWGAAGGLGAWCLGAGYLYFIGGPAAGFGSLVRSVGFSAAAASWDALCPKIPNYFVGPLPE